MEEDSDPSDIEPSFANLLNKGDEYYIEIPGCNSPYRSELDVENDDNIENDELNTEFQCISSRKERYLMPILLKLLQTLKIISGAIFKKEELAKEESTSCTNENSDSKGKINEYTGNIQIDVSLNPPNPLSRFKNETKLLSLFFNAEGSPDPHPKKEYVRCILIRSQKSSIRIGINGKSPTKNKIYYISLEGLEDVSSFKFWNEMTRVSIINEEAHAFMKQMSDTKYGPQTDGKCKKKNEQSSETKGQKQKSFNDEFCRWYFANDSIKEHYYYFIELIFAGTFCKEECLESDCERLCEKFDFRCCQGNKHEILCRKKWKWFKIFINDYMLTEIGIDPWFPEGYNREEIDWNEVGKHWNPPAPKHRSNIDGPIRKRQKTAKDEESDPSKDLDCPIEFPSKAPKLPDEFMINR